MGLSAIKPFRRANESRATQASRREIQCRGNAGVELGPLSYESRDADIRDIFVAERRSGRDRLSAGRLYRRTPASRRFASALARADRSRSDTPRVSCLYG